MFLHIYACVASGDEPFDLKLQNLTLSFPGTAGTRSNIRHGNENEHYDMTAYEKI